MEKLKERVHENQRVGIRELAENLNISYKSIKHILVIVLGEKPFNARLVQKTCIFGKTTIKLAMKHGLMNITSKMCSNLKKN